MANTEELVPVKVANRREDPDRFRHFKVYLSDDKAQQYFETWDIPTVAISPLDIYHEVTSGEEGIRGLTLLSYLYYRRVDFWWIIAAVNNIYMPSRDMVAGLTLRIPSSSSISIFLI